MDALTSTRMNLPVLSWRSLVKTTSGSAGTAVALSPTPISAATLTSSGTTATFTASSAHRLLTGQIVTISGAADSKYNLVGVQITVTSSTEFTYTIASGATSPDTGTPVANYSAHCQTALVRCPSTNTAEVNIGPDVNSDMHALPADSGWFEITAPSGSKINLANWYAKSTAASQTLHILYV